MAISPPALSAPAERRKLWVFLTSPETVDQAEADPLGVAAVGLLLAEQALFEVGALTRDVSESYEKLVRS